MQMVLFYYHFCRRSTAKLNLLQPFCEDLCLFINIDKTKVLIFKKAGRLINTHRFLIFGNTLSCTNSYKYLGILFSASGSFTPAKKQLYDKAVKALYSLKRNILSLNPSIFTSLPIFDHTIKPILMYGSEIRACSLSKKLLMVICLIFLEFPRLYISILVNIF